MSERQHLFPHFFFRTTGFPVEMLDGLSCPETTELAERLLELERGLAEMRREISDRVRQLVAARSTTAALSAAARKVKRKRPVGEHLLERLRLEGPNGEVDLFERYDAALAPYLEGVAGGEKLLAEETEAAREHLRETASDPRFGEAVLLSSPGAFDGFQRYARQAKKNAYAEKKILLYLQRLCSKNDTISFFGPMTWGRFDPQAVASCELSWNGSDLSSRHIFYEHWMAQALAEAMESDAELVPALPWRVGYPYEWDVAECKLYRQYPMSGRRQRAVETLAEELLAGLATVGSDGKQLSLGAVLVAVGERTDGDEAELLAVFETLRRQRIVRAFVVTVEALRPVEGLLANLLERSRSGAPGRDRWERRLRQLLELRDRFQSAALAERRQLLAELEHCFNRWTGSAARRSGGRTYAGRNLLYEECTRDPKEFVIGGPLYDDLEADLASVVEVQSALMEVVAPYGWQRLREIHQELADGEGKVLLSRFLLRLSRLVGSGYLNVSLARPEDEAALLERAEQILDLEPDGNGALTVSVRGSGAAERVALLERPVLMAADVMIAAPDRQGLEAGDYRFVVGEIQYFHLGYPEYLWTFHPDRKAFYDDYQRLIVEPRRGREPLARVELEPEVTRLIRLDEALADYVIVDGRGRIYNEDRAQRPLTELTVTLDDDRLLVEDRAGERYLLANPHHDLFLDACWKLLLGVYDRRCQVAREAGQPTPELRIGRRTTLVRRSWELDGSSLHGGRSGSANRWQAKPFAAFLEMQRIRRLNDLPRRLFARIPGEVKPVLVDFSSPLLLANLAEMAPEGKTLRLSEMRPAPGELWLERDEGHHTSEMRIFLA